MKNTILALSLLVLLSLMAACGNNNPASDAGTGNAANTADAANAANSSAAGNQPAENTTAETGNQPAETAEEPSAATRTVKYLDKEYVLPAKTERIVITGAVEAMEDAIVLDVNPVGAITFSGVFPPMFQSITQGTESVGEKIEPNFEKILSLKPDVILGSTKFKPEVAEKLEKIAPTIPYSHIATNWEANLQLLGELSGKQEQAAKAIADYKADLEAAKSQLGDKLKGKKVVAARIRGGEIYIYPASVFFNPVLYEDLGLDVPAEVTAAKAQEAVSVEKFAEMNPDYMFIQFAEDENKDKPKALEELQNNPILKNVSALKNGKAFVNVVDPLAQGGTAYSKIEFLKAAVANLAQ
ncbi:ABC transporter substrate-binding protein [Paenibacillus lycopersici]|uniref:ABC transporter substrate-binding protein n=1 Tax=Paenibacillus lycopersici TaxID=2704462 RepID=A0A6C0FN56_9BACL|nr:ABC transporter substrate-binding protein [Paenibacillus lycopersici]QHT58566.1 ABC transporter substrate-binding protein [Paenibacillus lycopersici]